MSGKGRHVKGILFGEYVRMLRAHRDVDWAAHLDENATPFLACQIDASSWYPMDVFEQMGLAILAEVAGNDLDQVRAWGHRSIDDMLREHPDIVSDGDPRESLMRFQILRQSLFDYPAVEVVSIFDREARFDINYGMSLKAEEAACHQTLGFLECLLGMSGAKDIEAEIRFKSWDGDPKTTIVARWRSP